MPYRAVCEAIQLRATTRILETSKYLDMGPAPRCIVMAATRKVVNYCFVSLDEILKRHEPTNELCDR